MAGITGCSPSDLIEDILQPLGSLLALFIVVLLGRVEIISVVLGAARIRAIVSSERALTLGLQRLSLVVYAGIQWAILSVVGPKFLGG